MAEIVQFPREPRRLQIAVEFGNRMVGRLVEVLSAKGYHPDVQMIQHKVTQIIAVMFKDEPEIFDGRASEDLEHSASTFAYDRWADFTS